MGRGVAGGWKGQALARWSLSCLSGSMAERDPEDLSGVDTHALATLITESKASGGAETANTQVLIERLTRALDLPTADLTGEEDSDNNYTATL